MRSGATLLNRPGWQSEAPGCTLNNLNVRLNDEASQAIENDCASNPICASLQSHYRPGDGSERPLAVFDGQRLAGEWFLSVSDHRGLDVGSLDRWCLIAPTARTPSGPDFQVNSYITGDQEYSAIAADANGDFVVVWASAGSSGTDTSGRSIQGQRYAADGSTISAEFQVNSHTTSTQNHPAMAMQPDGQFVVAWSSRAASGTDTQNFSVQAQRYATNGSALGSEFQVNTFTAGYQYRPAVATRRSLHRIHHHQPFTSSASSFQIVREAS